MLGCSHSVGAVQRDGGRDGVAARHRRHRHRRDGRAPPAAAAALLPRTFSRPDPGLQYPGVQATRNVKCQALLCSLRRNAFHRQSRVNVHIVTGCGGPPAVGSLPTKPVRGEPSKLYCYQLFTTLYWSGEQPGQQTGAGRQHRPG